MLESGEKRLRPVYFKGRSDFGLRRPKFVLLDASAKKTSEP